MKLLLLVDYKKIVIVIKENMSVLNNLTREVNSYLLKHSKDPINWHPWGEKAFKKAFKENKPIFLSIGYLSCHWCNVMASESFSDQSIAKILNNNFVNIKVDREERPDIDKFYMNSLISMGIDIGWPLNVFLLPDGRPFYGGTYFEKDIFLSLIKDISDSFINHRDKLEEASIAFVETVNSNLNKYHIINNDSQNNTFSMIFCKNLFKKIYNLLDHRSGGFAGQYKFPSVDLGIFLLNYAKIILTKDQDNIKTSDDKAINALKLMLDKLSYGGIYDHLGGGFCRYSVDSEWHIPHFEKMLYDNAQLISLYSKSFNSLGKKEEYKNIVYNTIKFCEKELLDKCGGFYCSISSDSEEEEGKYYLWTKKEIIEILGLEEGELFCKYYNITKEGNWEENKNILFKSEKNNIYYHNHEINDIIESCKRKLFNERLKREYPIVDDKILGSWNGIMIRSFLEAYNVFREPRFLENAIKTAEFIKNNLIKENSIWHSYYKGKVYQKGYLEDYAWIIRSFLELYLVTLNENWCFIAKDILESTIDRFYDEKDGFFFFSSLKEGELFSNKKYTLDTSIASANAIMCENLSIIGKLFDNEKYSFVSDNMLKNILSSLADDPEHFLYWSNLVLQKVAPNISVIIQGKDFENWIYKIKKLEYQNILIVGSNNNSQIPLIKNKNIKDNDSTIAYICIDKHCIKPIDDLDIVLEKIKKYNNQEILEIKL